MPGTGDTIKDLVHIDLLEQQNKDLSRALRDCLILLKDHYYKKGFYHYKMDHQKALSYAEAKVHEYDETLKKSGGLGENEATIGHQKND